MRSFLALVLVVVLGAPLAHADTVLFQDNFEGQTLGAAVVGLTPPVGGDYVGSSANVIVADASLQALPGASNSGKFLTSTTFGQSAFANLSAAGQTASTGKVVKFDFDMYAQDVAYGSALGFGSYLGTGSDSNWYASNVFDVNLLQNGTVTYYNDGDTTLQTATGTFARNTWIHVHVVADYGLETYSVNVGGVTFSDAFNSAANSVGCLYLAPGGVTSIDNLSITTPVPEPSTLLLTALGLLGLLAYAWRKRK